MVRILLIILLGIAVFAAAHYYGDYAGSVVIDVAGYTANTNIPFLVISMFAAFVVLGLLLKLLGTIVFFRKKIDKWRGKTITKTLDRWNIAVMAGDNTAMQKSVKSLPNVFQRRYADSALLMQAKAKLENGRYDEASSIYQGLLGTPSKRLPALKGLCDIALLQQDHEKATDTARQAAEEYPKIIWPRLVLRHISLTSRDWRLGAFRAEELIYLLPEDENDNATYTYAAAALKRAEELFLTGDRSKALSLAAKAHKTAGDHDNITLVYAQFLKQAKEKGALQHLVYERWKTSPHYNLGILFADSLEEANERTAIKKIAALQECNTESALTYLVRAYFYEKIGHGGTAKEEIRKAQDIKPSKEGYELAMRLEEQHGSNDRFAIEEMQKEAEHAVPVTEIYLCRHCSHAETLPVSECPKCLTFDAYRGAA